MAFNFIKPEWVCLDAASGSGYCVEILSKKAKKVVGIDYNEHAINHAKEHHKRTNNEFFVADLNGHLKFSDNTFDAITSFETIEHVKNQNNMLSEFHRILKPGGMMLMSTPDKDIYTDKVGINSIFHVSELGRKEFIEKLSQFFEIENVYGQTVFVDLPLYKKIIKFLVKLDFLGLRRIIVRKLNLVDKVHENFSPEIQTGIELVNITEPARHYLVVVLAKNRK
jgi:ubiquinone/menaquinone biosynthesis C-methylase UbiE